MEYDPAHLTPSQMFLAHSRADRTLRAIIGDQLEPFNLNLMEWLLLAAVREGGKDGCTLSEVAEKLSVSQPQVTALMNKVLAPRLVRQKVSRQDRRSKNVVLTPKGQKLLDSVEKAVNDFLAVWLSEVPKTKWKNYSEILVRMAKYTPEAN